MFPKGARIARTVGMYRQVCSFLALFGSAVALLAADPEGVKRVDVWNYEDCIELSNGDTTVVLCHQVGGRVIKYAWKGKEALYLSPKEKEWTPDQPLGKREASAGRFDIGPEYQITRGQELWAGEWKAEVLGDRRARLTSVEDSASGVQLVREFTLDAETSHLACTQIIRNHSNETKRWCHWSRTFAKHGGMAVVPLTPELSRMPKRYVMVDGQGHIDPKPEDPNIRIRDGFLEILAPPAFPKLGFDSYAGWFAYVTPDDLAFVKSYQTYPDRDYNELAGYTISIWYPQAGIPACELEPIGPATELAPQESAAFTEHWRLLDQAYPKDGALLDLAGLAAQVSQALGG